MVSSAMRRRFSGGTKSSVRMLCVRSASFTRITRTSRAIASSILRKLSGACSRLWNSSLSSLVSPSTSSATLGPNFSASSLLVMPWSSITSCSSAAMMDCTSSFQSAHSSATATGWVM